MTELPDPDSQPTQPDSQPTQPDVPPPTQHDAPSPPPPHAPPPYAPPPPPAQIPYQPAPPPGEGYGYGQIAPAAAPPGMYVDAASGLTLPVGVELASVGRRIGAYFLAIPLAIVTLGIGYLVWGLIVWGRGQTPALQVLGMRCWRPETRQTASWGWMALREIVGRLLEGILSVITLLISFILMVTGKERRTIHDYVAGTVVLSDPNQVLGS
jgi:uncharacterized RDD family membrane protein YckC